MKNRGNTITIIFAMLGLLVLILDSQSAIQGAAQGLELCLRTVIPSLFPFFYLSGIVSKHLTGKSTKVLKPIGRICGVPAGCEPILLIGWLGGYPVGAQIVTQAYKNKNITQNDAQRMLSFCNQPGPAFIFAVIGTVFQSVSKAFIIWIIIILSALITAVILPGKSKEKCMIEIKNTSDPFQAALRSICYVCGWVILFRVFIVILSRWLLWSLPIAIQTIFVGMLELTNGCMGLHVISNDAMRMIIGAFMLSFGGLCVGLQTRSIISPLSCKKYFGGKAFQSLIAVILTYLYTVLFH